ncbi:hypothetical protein VNO78_04678 [Psophocarpus tetragonolobus]|uniref:Uncharacterized protein n=1 Tax=Psophocarpus tetragonolobus TaxID=3891 RepID=A0AAN9T5S2_PSOTE
MAHQSDLVKIGLEGFDLIDRFYGAPIRRPVANGGKQRQGRWGVQATQNHKEDTVLNSKEAASKFGGIVVMNYYPKTKPQNRWGKFIQAFKP